MRRHTTAQLIRMKQDEKFTGVDWNMFKECLPAPLLEESDVEISPSSNTSTDQHNLSTVSVNDLDNEHIQDIRNELVVRFLTAISIDYEKQWYLGMVHRRTLDILIKSVEEAKAKCSLQLHWQLIVNHFRLPFLLRHLIRFNHFDAIHTWTNKLLFDHILQTIELTLGSLL